MEKQNIDVGGEFPTKAIDVLTEKEQEIYLFLKGANGSYPSLLDASNRFGISRERVRQILEGALRKLKSASDRFEIILGSSNGKPFGLSLAPREHVLVCGAPGAGKTILLQRMIAELRSRYADCVDIIVFDPKGCEYSGAGVTLFRHEKSIADLFRFINDFQTMSEPTLKTTFFFIDEIDSVVYPQHQRQILQELFSSKKNAVLVLSTQVAKFLEPFVAQSSIFIQFRQWCDQEISVFSDDFGDMRRPEEMGECVVKSNGSVPLLVQCEEYKRK